MSAQTAHSGIKRKGDQTNPHRGDCTGTLCPDCGCCQHCPVENGRCLVCPGCSDRICECAVWTRTP